MRYKGNLVSDVIISDQSLKLKDLNNIYFQNKGAVNVTIGTYTLRPEQEYRIETGNISIDTNLTISFDRTTGGTKSLYYHAIKITETICD
ncbi:conserved protein of unknown function [Tenacibaculum sp. 190130A14a]|uniref:Auto-transporter adhesin head GIN domain-containing protein n=1 Tax=Tenacibaculum polynesiense TaxID=3137857 RepID=A0ABM9PFS9_9FLAO